jgi:hemerythrin-like metal-binding protein
MGVEVIDYQHKRLVQLINDLYETNQDRTFKEGLMEIILDELSRYTIYHFAKEEELMEKVSYINIRDHKVQHANFVKRLEAFRMQYNHKDDIKAELFEFLKTWLQNHILVEDQQIANHMSHCEGLV